MEGVRLRDEGEVEVSIRSGRGKGEEVGKTHQTIMACARERTARARR
jgi:hypothetical protein